MEEVNGVALESPELLLPRLNAALRELRGAVDLLEEPALGEQMAPMMRSLLLAEVLGQEWILAIGGSQGAGKTTLVRTMYGLAGADAAWLPANEGQGEKMPVLVLEEAGRERVEGAVRCLCPGDGGRYEIQEQTLEVDAFRRAVTDPEPRQLLPVLKVPQRYFHRPHQAWLLLPGYEKEDRENQDWQRLMRQALVGAAGCVIVTDETRMANQQQQEIVRDMLSNELRGARPLVVVTKTEAIRGNAGRVQELRRTAREVFALPADVDDRWIVCAGSDDADYVEEWLPELATNVGDLALSGGGVRAAQLSQLEVTLRRDLANVLSRLQIKAKLFLERRNVGDDGPREVVKSFLDAYDNECAVVREGYQGQINVGLDAIFRKALDELTGRLKSNHEGIVQHLKDYFRKASDSLGRIEDDITKAWAAGGSVLEAHAKAIGTITMEKLSAPREAFLASDAARQPEAKASALQRLGYEDGKAVVHWAHPTEDERHNLQVLLGTSGQAAPNKDLMASVALLPVLALEYARLASVLPESVGVNGDTLQPAVDLERPNLVGESLGRLRDGVGVGQNVLRGIAAMLALDVAVDGKVDVVDILTSVFTGKSAEAPVQGDASGGAGGAATPVVASAAITGFGAAVIGVVAVGYLVHSAMRQVRLHDSKAIQATRTMLRGIRDHHQVHFMAHYDDMMKRLRTRLHQALRTRFHLDELLMEQDRLAKSLADVRALRRDLLHQIERTGQSLPLFLPPPSLA